MARSCSQTAGVSTRGVRIRADCCCLPGFCYGSCRQLRPGVRGLRAPNPGSLPIAPRIRVEANSGSSFAPSAGIGSHDAPLHRRRLAQRAPFRCRFYAPKARSRTDSRDCTTQQYQSSSCVLRPDVCQKRVAEEEGWVTRTGKRRLTVAVGSPTLSHPSRQHARPKVSAPGISL